MTGYQETVTDPSYAEQLVCFTAAMVGNYGVADERRESRRAAREGGAHALARRRGVGRWLREHGLVGLEGIDTRSLVLRLREAGAMRLRPSPTRRASTVDAALAQVRAQPADGGSGARRAGLDVRALRLPPRALRTSPWSTTARSAPIMRRLADRRRRR